jgi:exopolyphosphatase/guanosine-5'-triphosphate,3'-diphosphate pyrophosphatase
MMKRLMLKLLGAVGYKVTDPLRGPKAPLEETNENLSGHILNVEDKIASQDLGSGQTHGTQNIETKGLPDSENDVSSGSKNSKNRSRWKKRQRSKDPVSSPLKTISKSPVANDGVIANHTDVTTDSNLDTPAPVKKNRKRRNRSKNVIPPAQVQTPAQTNDAPNSAFQHLAAPVQNHNKSLYAALDLGTNNCRLLVAKPTKAGQFRVVDAFSRIVRLGEGLAATGKLSDAAMDRAVGALKICASKLSRHNIKNYRLIATEACRQATNGEEFLARVKRETELNLEIINRETEAQLAVSGCASLVERETHSVILFDIGGGSSEIAAIQFDEKRTQRLANHIKSWTSLPVGVVTLSERHGGQNVTPEVFSAMVEEVDGLINTTAPDAMLNFAPDIDTFHLLGTSGTVTTLAGLHLDLPRYDRRQVDGLWLQDEDVDKMLNQLLSWDLETRSANPCIGPDRSDLVLAGCAIMQSIRKRWPSNRMRVADRGLREGLLNDMMAKDGVWRRRRRRRPAGHHNHPHSGTHQNANPASGEGSEQT